MTAIRVTNISKTYRLYRKPVDRLKEMLLRRPQHEAFEPLREISFELEPGGILGIIGENGAGKSTLLKVLAGTLAPTTGEIICQGRVAALLELGAGFHPEFTGRQNIHLNATLLGLSDDEIREREAGIVEFSELGSFIEHPVKTYSSGMYVRLAFSIATSVDPDILIIDEALSVGDVRFQRKCVSRMLQFREQGKTMLFCTHDLYQVRELCKNVIWLKNGRLHQYGAAADVSSAYLSYLEEKQIEKKTGDPHRPLDAVYETETPEVLIEAVRIYNEKNEEISKLRQFESLRVEIHTRCTKPGFKGHIGLILETPDKQTLFAASTKHSGHDSLIFSGNQTIQLELPTIPLGSGMCYFKAVSGDESALRIIDIYKTRYYTISSERPEFGIVWMKHRWRLPAQTVKQAT